MDHQQSDFTGFDETQIFYQVWLPEEEVNGAMIVLHGFGGHSGRYLNVVNTLIDQRIAIYALDHRGHGRSGGRQNYVNRFSDFLQDLSIFEQIVVDKHPNSPLFLLGHSMGSIIATHYIAQHLNQEKFKSLILSGSGSVFGPEINRIRIWIAKALSIVVPRLSIPSNLDARLISRDEEVVEAYIEDPLVHHDEITVRLIAETLKHTSQMEDIANNITIPTLIQVGSNDNIFDPESSKRIINAIENEDSELKIYEDYRHEVYSELGNEIVLDDLRSWVVKFIEIPATSDAE